MVEEGREGRTARVKDERGYNTLPFCGSLGRESSVCFLFFIFAGALCGGYSSVCGSCSLLLGLFVLPLLTTQGKKRIFAQLNCECNTDIS